MRITNDPSREVIDLDQLVQEALDKYEAAFFTKIENELFIFQMFSMKIE